MNASEGNQRLKTLGRNDLCSCGSGKKYKKCHLPSDEAARHAQMLKANEDREAALAEEAEENQRAGAKGEQKKRDNPRRVGAKALNAHDKHTNIPRRGAV